MPHWPDLVVIGANLVAGAGLLVLLAVLTWVSWGVVRTTAAPQQALMRRLRGRLLLPLWLVLAVFVVTAVVGELRSGAAELPHVWEFAIGGANGAYALLAVAAYLCIVQIVLGLGTLTWRAQDEKDRAGRVGRSVREEGPDLGAALIGAFSLTAAFFGLAAMAAVDYLQGLAHTFH